MRMSRSWNWRRIARHRGSFDASASRFQPGQRHGHEEQGPLHQVERVTLKQDSMMISLKGLGCGRGETDYG
jgi:hypothetical protein